MWLMGDESMKSQMEFVNLRYRLMPYIYSLAGAVTHKNFTIMRALAMDFPNDTDALSANYQYMYGKEFLVCPVTDAGVKSQTCYLPKGASWFDFWTGEKYDGGKNLSCMITLQNMPLFVRAGSIIPMGPYMQYANEKKQDKLEIRIYPGADGSFTIYEDEGENYNYEKGHFATIELKWNEASKTLTIGKQQGEFAGMLKQHTFNIVLVNKENGSGVGETMKAEKQISYVGDEMKVQL
jgi:alpha-D-xyloside xylohydrolase